MEPPDTLEKGIRFGCGFSFAFILVAAGGLSWAVSSGSHVLAVAIAAGVVFGVLALRFGDAFWHRVAALLRWW
mgnify:FL=1